MKRTTVLAVLILLSLPNHLWAQAPTPGATNFAIIGIAFGQSLKLNLLAYPPTPNIPGTAGFPPTLCVATLGYQDGNGNLLGATMPVTLAVGQTASLTLSFAEAIAAEAAIAGNAATGPAAHAVVGAAANGMPRIEVVPMVTTTGNAAQCVATLEVVDNLLRVTSQGFTGTVAYPGAPIFGPESVYPLQNMELNVQGTPTLPCIAQLSFQDGSGNPVGPTKNVDTFFSASLTLLWQTLYPGFPGTTPPVEPLLITPIVTYTSPSSACIATGEMIVPIFGRSWEFYPLEPLPLPLPPIYIP